MFKHALIWLITSVLTLVFLPGLLNPQTYMSEVKSDQRHLAEEIGEHSASIIIDTTDRIYNKLFEESGLHPWVNAHYANGLTPKNELFQENNTDKITKFLKTYTGTFFISMYESTFRLTQLGYWAVVAFPFFLAAAFDGLMTRKVRIISFHYSSPTQYNAMWHLIIILFAGTFVYSNTPFPMPAPIFPLLVFAASMGIRALLANLQRSA